MQAPIAAQSPQAAWLHITASAPACKAGATAKPPTSETSSTINKNLRIPGFGDRHRQQVPCRAALEWNRAAITRSKGHAEGASAVLTSHADRRDARLGERRGERSCARMRGLLRVFDFGERLRIRMRSHCAGRASRRTVARQDARRLVRRRSARLVRRARADAASDSAGNAPSARPSGLSQLPTPASLISGAFCR